MSSLRLILVVLFVTCTAFGTSGIFTHTKLAVISLVGTVAAALLIYLSYRKRHVKGIDATLMIHEPQDRTMSAEVIDPD